MSERITLRHPDLDTIITVDRHQARVLEASGWVQDGGKAGFIEAEEEEPTEGEFSGRSISIEDVLPD